MTYILYYVMYNTAIVFPIYSLSFRLSHWRTRFGFTREMRFSNVLYRVNMNNIILNKTWKYLYDQFLSKFLMLFVTKFAKNTKKHVSIHVILYIDYWKKKILKSKHHDVISHILKFSHYNYVILLIRVNYRLWQLHLMLLQ